jgi:hypothetical protein
LGILASLQLIDPSVANIALVKASDALQMHGAVLALGASVSTLAQAASVLVMAYSWSAVLSPASPSAQCSPALLPACASSPRPLA